MERMGKIMLAILWTFLFCGCSTKVDTSPRAIDPSIDICATCNMSIADMHFAGEIITNQGQVVKFDDIGCLILYFKKHQQDPAMRNAVIYVKDFKTTEWISAQKAHYVKGRIDTPMNFGIVGFALQEEAQTFAQKLEGATLMDWQEVQTVKQTVNF